ncbi:MAG: transporter substrate-binding domain-containing protein [Gammaproteobacteria bacterium]
MRKIANQTRYLCAVILAYALIFMLPISHAAELKLAADDWPPFTSDKPGQRIAADLVEKALKRSEIVTKLNITQWNDVLEGIKTKKYDAIVGAWKNAERGQFLLFSRPYLENRIMLVGRTGNKIDFNDASQLANKRIGVVKGYAYGEAISRNKKITKVESPTVIDSVKKLLNKEVDFILTDSIVAQSMKQHLPQDVKKNLVIYNKVVVTQSLHFAIRKSYPNANVLLEKFNNVIRSMIADGSYNRILGFAWLVADTDGDGVEEYIVGDKIPSKNDDPAISGNSYAVFSKEQSANKKPQKKYRVLNLQYNSWDEAQQAINQGQVSGRFQYEEQDTETVDLFSGKF